MSVFLVLAFLFCIGSLVGWGIEVLFRKFFSDSNPEHKWVNPGFLTGPYLPLYGSGLVILFLIAALEDRIPFSDPIVAKAVLFLIMAVCMTGIEYFAGIMSLKIGHVRLWDYSNNWGNIQGIICPLFSLFWTILGAIYYFLIHPHVLNALYWLANNLAFSFFIGMFYGIFLLDLVHASKILVTISRFAAEKQIVVHYEDLKERIRTYNISHILRARFIFSMYSDRSIRDHLSDYYESVIPRVSRLKDVVENLPKPSRKK